MSVREELACHRIGSLDGKSSVPGMWKQGNQHTYGGVSILWQGALYSLMRNGSRRLILGCSENYSPSKPKTSKMQVEGHLRRLRT